jgi:hypothetical protein
LLLGDHVGLCKLTRCSIGICSCRRVPWKMLGKNMRVWDESLWSPVLIGRLSMLYAMRGRFCVGYDRKSDGFVSGGVANNVDESEMKRDSKEKRMELDRLLCRMPLQSRRNTIGSLSYRLHPPSLHVRGQLRTVRSDRHLQTFATED